MEFNTIAELKANPSELKKVLIEHGYDRKSAMFTFYAIRDGELTLKEALERCNSDKMTSFKNLAVGQSFRCKASNRELVKVDESTAKDSPAKYFQANIYAMTNPNEEVMIGAIR